MENLIISAYFGSGFLLILALVAILPEPTLVPLPCLGPKVFVFAPTGAKKRQHYHSYTRGKRSYPDKPP